MDISHFLVRLDNWRRVYGDKRTHWTSPTYTACKYAEAMCDRLHETEEEREKREKEELEYREPVPPSPDYKDAELLQDVWAMMPDFIEYVPVKKNIKVFVFGTPRELEKRRQKAGAYTAEGFVTWRNQFIKLFFERAEREAEIREQFCDII